MTQLEQLEHDIELAKLDNAAFLVSKHGSQMTAKELANNGIRGNILDIMGDTIPILKVIEKMNEGKLRSGPLL